MASRHLGERTRREAAGFGSPLLSLRRHLILTARAGRFKQPARRIRPVPFLPIAIMPDMAWSFPAQLARFGPDAPYPPVARADARAYCSWVARTHYENFSVASLLLPRRLLRHFHAVYAYCRWSDDLADESGGGQRALDLLAWWRTELLA